MESYKQPLMIVMCATHLDSNSLVFLHDIITEQVLIISGMGCSVQIHRKLEIWHLMGLL